MSLQTLTLNCLACHILAKHPQLTNNNKVYSLTSFKATKTSIKQVNLTTLTDKTANNTNSSIKIPLRKIA